MKITQILKSVEEFIYELIFLIYQTPKTFLKVTSSPKWAVSYVKTELDNEDEKFTEYLSPLLFWSIVVIIPAFAAINHYSARIDLNLGGGFLTKFLRLSVEGRFLAIALLLVSFPLSFAFVLQKEMKRKISKNEFRENFYIQCYCLAPLQFFLIIFTIGSEVYNETTFGKILTTIYGLYFLWFIYYEVVVIYAQLGKEFGKSFWLIIKSFAISFFVMLFFELIVALGITWI